MAKHPKWFFNLMVILLGVYVALTVAIEPSAQTLARFNISLGKAYTIIISIDAFFALIWLSAAYGFVQILSYSLITKHAKDGRAFQKVAWGLGLIAFRQPINSIMGSLVNWLLTSHPQWQAATTIITNYVGVLIALLGFGLIYIGSEQLVSLTRKAPSQWPRAWFRVLGLLLITAYAYLAIGRGGYQVPLPPATKATFYLPNWLIVSTIVVPYAYSWYMAITASYNLRFYAVHIKGVLYKPALRWLAVGINIILFNTIVLQFMGTQNVHLNELRLGPLLLLDYLVLTSLAVGFIVLAVGAKKLRRIEEV